MTKKSWLTGLVLLGVLALWMMPAGSNSAFADTTEWELVPAEEEEKEEEGEDESFLGDEE